jgi:hypothetical protein
MGERDSISARNIDFPLVDNSDTDSVSHQAPYTTVTVEVAISVVKKRAWRCEVNLIPRSSEALRYKPEGRGFDSR